MNWLLCFIILLLMLVSATAFASVVAVGKYKRGRVLTPFNIVFGGVFLSVFISLLPIYSDMLSSSAGSVLKVIAFSLHNTDSYIHQIILILP